MTSLRAREFVAVNGAAAAWRPDGALEIATCPTPWGYSLTFPLAAPEWLARGERSLLVECELVVSEGGIGLSCLDTKRNRLVTGEILVSSRDTGAPHRLFVEPITADTVLLLRNGADGGPSRGILHRLEVGPGSGLAEGERRRFLAQRFPYWHYEHDLGHGARTVPTRPEIAGWHALRRRILSGILEDRYGPSLAGRRCLDFACCSGFWSFFLAEKGAAHVIGVDADPGYIAQARLVQSLSPDPAHQKVEFRHADMVSFRPERPCDLVLCLGVMYHLTDPVGGARSVFGATGDLALIDSSVSSLPGAVLELADHTKYPCCFENEFAFVPTEEALTRIFRHAGFTKLRRHVPDDPEAHAAYGPGAPRVLLIAEK